MAESETSSGSGRKSMDGERKAKRSPRATAVTLDEKRRILQLETLHDLALALRAEADEQELLDELLLRACAVLDPAAAVAVTRDDLGRGQAAAAVGWPSGDEEIVALADHPTALELPQREAVLVNQPGRFGSRPYRQLLACALRHRDRDLGFIAVLDKEGRGPQAQEFSEDDERFLSSVAALSAVALDNARAVQRLETQRERLEAENQALKDRWSWRTGAAGKSGDEELIVARAPVMRTALQLAERVAPRGVSVLLRGESGTGKELVARLLHFESQRSGPLIAINCAALPESLLESELFGIEGGVATGVQARPGKFQLADRGTLFLDEIGDIPSSVQVRLLRVLQEREVLKVGGRRPQPVDVRVIAATHRNLAALVAGQSYREDLYYRLKGVEIELPPLRRRREDIPHLVRHFAERFCQREGIPVPAIDTEATTRLMAYEFPGNVRELQNVVEGAISLSEGRIDGDLVRTLLSPREGDLQTGQDGLDLRSVEEGHIRRILRLTEGNKSAAARLLGIDRRTLARKGF
ncbi:MAG: sigma 54-interacting transcriptional regulator [Acidobacteriota bacterium]